MSKKISIQSISCPHCGECSLQIEGVLPFHDIDADLYLDRNCISYNNIKTDFGFTDNEYAWCRECYEETSYDQLFKLAKDMVKEK